LTEPAQYEVRRQLHTIKADIASIAQRFALTVL
jgi:hypothetical protein